jgi:FtsZ-binding cell division protein ZapB
MLNPDNETLEWCAKWIEDSLRAETNERTIEFGRNIAMTFRAAIIPADNDYCARCGSYSLLPYHCDNCGNDLGPRPTLIPAEVQHHPRAVELLVNCAECGSILNAEICNHDERPFGKQIHDGNIAPSADDHYGRRRRVGMTDGQTVQLLPLTIEELKQRHDNLCTVIKSKTEAWQQLDTELDDLHALADEVEYQIASFDAQDGEADG